MKKTNIKSRNDVTFLAKAYLDKLITKAKKGEIYFKKGNDGEISNLYFDKKYFSEVLMVEISATSFIKKISESNSFDDWNNLRMAILNSIDDEHLNLATLELYSIVDENDTLINHSELLLEQLLTEDPESDLKPWKKIENDLKNLFPSLGIDVFRQDNVFRIAFNIPIKSEIEQQFTFKPFIKILEKHDMKLMDIKQFKGVNKNAIFTSIFFDNK